MMSYWANFARSGNPNGKGLPTWPLYNAASGAGVMHLDTTIAAKNDANRPRYEALDALPREVAGRVCEAPGRRSLECGSPEAGAEVIVRI